MKEETLISIDWIDAQSQIAIVLRDEVGKLRERAHYLAAVGMDKMAEIHRELARDLEAVIDLNNSLMSFHANGGGREMAMKKSTAMILGVRTCAD